MTKGFLHGQWEEQKKGGVEETRGTEEKEEEEREDFCQNYQVRGLYDFYFA